MLKKAKHKNQHTGWRLEQTESTTLET